MAPNPYKSKQEDPTPVFFACEGPDDGTTGKITGPSKGVLGELPGGILGVIRTWKQLRSDIQKYQAVIDRNMEEVDASLVRYRLVFTELTYKNAAIDQEVWASYQRTIADFEGLQERTRRTPLLLKSNKQLEALRELWSDLYQRQQTLLNQLTEAAKQLASYNQIQVLRVKQEEDQRRWEENNVKVSGARASLEASIHYIDKLQQEGDAVTLGSKILRLEDARITWDDQLAQIQQIERSGTESNQEILARILKLEKTIRDTPSSAKWIRSIEDKFEHLISMHDVLVSYGKNLIPQSEIARVTVMLYEKAPKLWATGNQAELERLLKALDNFLNHYDNQVYTEIALTEHRKPGLIRTFALNADTEKIELPQFSQMVRSLVNAIDSRDHFMRGHSVKVTELALQMASRLKWNGSSLEYLEIASLLHDVGKLSIPETILTKADPFTQDERRMIQLHPYYGVQIVKPIPALSRIVPWIYHHQERWDGMGYPDQLAKKDIPMAASIISVAEAFSVMTIDLPRREALATQDALEKIQEEAGKQFNPEVVEVLADYIQAHNQPTQVLPAHALLPIEN